MKRFLALTLFVCAFVAPCFLAGANVERPGDAGFGNFADPKVVEVPSPLTADSQYTRLNRSFSTADGQSRTIVLAGLTQYNAQPTMDAVAENYTEQDAVPLKFVNENYVDAEKWSAVEDPLSEGLQDSYLCWAAATCNVLRISGWAAAGSGTEDDLFTMFGQDFINRGGYTSFGLDWYFDGVYPTENTSASPWMPSDNNSGQQREFVASSVYADYDLTRDPFGICQLERSEGETFAASIGELEDGRIGTSGHAITVNGLIYDPADDNLGSRYKAIIIANSDNDATPSIPEETATDDQRRADRAARPNSYTVYALNYTADADGKPCWEVVNYAEDCTTIIHRVTKVAAPDSEAAQAAREEEGSKDSYKSADFRLRQCHTTQYDKPDTNDSISDDYTDSFAYGQDVYVNFKLLNASMVDLSDGDQALVPVKLVVRKDGETVYSQVHYVNQSARSNDFTFQHACLGHDAFAENGTYSLTIEANPAEARSYEESYYKNNVSGELLFTIVGAPEPDPKPDPAPDPDPGDNSGSDDNANALVPTGDAWGCFAAVFAFAVALLGGVSARALRLRRL